jgi:mono/diheme cytochrome c family protein
MSRWLSLLLAFALVSAVGCAEQESEEDLAAAKAAARADSLAAAEAAYDAAVFDTLTWESQDARVERGALVWNVSCTKCHGDNGGGNGEMAMELQLEVPSFMVPDWEYAGDLDALRHRIFVGYSGEMPNWGIVGLSYRDVDALALYVAAKLGPQTAQN